MPITYRPYQLRGAQWFAERPKPQAGFFPWKMGAGKTLGACAALAELNPDRALIICPAGIRPVWVRVLREAFPNRIIGSIELGRTAKPQSKAQGIERDAAYEAPWQVVNYDLLGHIRVDGWQMIVLDEVHYISAPTSQQSKRVRAITRTNPDAAILGLSGTMIRNEAKQLWNQLDTLFPGEYGRPTPAGRESFEFCARFCNKEINAYGKTDFYGLRPERRAALEALLSKISFVVEEAEFAAYVPPLFVEQLDDPKCRGPLKVAQEWAAGLDPDVGSFGVFTHLRETAGELSSLLRSAFPDREVVEITGADNAQKRDDKLQNLRLTPNAILVGTTHALREGISLSFIKAALVAEFTSSVVDLIQFIGRFARADSTSTMPTRVDILVGPNDVSKMQKLRQRTDDINSVIKAGRAETLASGAFQEKAMTDDLFQSRLDTIIAGQSKRLALWGSDDDEEDGDSDD